MPRTDTIGYGCSRLTVTVGGRRVGLSLVPGPSIADLDAGRPLNVTTCEPFSLPAGETRVSAQPGLFTPYVLRMRSRARNGEPASREVVSAGTATRGGREGVKLELDEPARLVLAESYNRGRRASCDGKDLGTPEVGGVYGTAWRVPKTCSDVTIAFAPNRLVNAGYALSLVVGAAPAGVPPDPPPGERPEPPAPLEPAPATAR